jgi:octaprenyl-diphosphate synthase
MTQITALQQAAKSHTSASKANAHLNAIISLISDVLPELEEIIARATRGPAPLDEAARQLIFAGGKRIRPLATLLIEKACGSHSAKSLPLAAAIELVHSAALLHDDVIDEGDERRGKPASRMVWGNLVSVLSGDLLLTSAMELLISSDIPGVLNDMLETMRAMLTGEVLQLQARGRYDLEIDEYFDIVRGKTASLFANACRAGARSANADTLQVDAAWRFGEHFGIAFQIIDDILDLEGVREEVGKQLGKDLSEGRTTLPISIALQEDRSSIRPLLAKAEAGIDSALVHLAATPSVRRGCAQARKLALAETEKGVAALSLLPPSQARELLAGLARNLVDRRN